MEIQDVKEECANQVTLLNNKIDALKQDLNKSNNTIDILKV